MKVARVKNMKYFIIFGTFFILILILFFIKPVIFINFFINLIPRAYCFAKSGTFVEFHLGSSPMACNRKSADAGKSCAENKDCEGYCVRSDVEELNSERKHVISWQCSETANLLRPSNEDHQRGGGSIFY